MHKSFTRLSLAAALMMGLALPVMAQTASAPAVAVPGPRAAVTGTVAAPGAAPAVTPVAPTSTAQPSAPLGRPMTTAPAQSARPATAAPATVQTPRPGASRVIHRGSSHAQHSAATTRPVAVRTN